jgi:arylsulfatase A-like enzyme
MLAAAGVAADPNHPLDGTPLQPALARPDCTFARPMHWRMKHRSQRALRDGCWKYLKVDDHEYLFDADTDERERANLARRYPDRIAALRRAWEQWDASMGPIPHDATVSTLYGAADMPAR